MLVQIEAFCVIPCTFSCIISIDLKLTSPLFWTKSDKNRFYKKYYKMWVNPFVAFRTHAFIYA